MIDAYFENLLKKTYQPSSQAEAMWDSRATKFSLSQQSEKTKFPERVTELLTSIGYLPGNTVLDIGGGTGRYALPFASVAQSVTISDLSNGMLKQAEKNAKEKALDNIDYLKMDWETAEIVGSPYEKAYDIAFASMCPAIRSKSGLIKMIAAAKKGCVINQFTKMSDTIIESLKKASGSEAQYDPHNDRTSVQAIFNLLWSLGYSVHLTYHTYSASTYYTVQEAQARYGGRFSNRTFFADGKPLSFEDMMTRLIGDEPLLVKNETILATLFWDV